MMRNSLEADQPVRTMWEAARDLFEDAFAYRDAEMWGRGYRLWILASRMRAPGQPFTLMSYHAKWMPTEVRPDAHA
jgi:hypothetical protein